MEHMGDILRRNEFAAEGEIGEPEAEQPQGGGV